MCSLLTPLDTKRLVHVFRVLQKDDTGKHKCACVETMLRLKSSGYEDRRHSFGTHSYCYCCYCYGVVSHKVPQALRSLLIYCALTI
jgi:hypothetical protein